MLVPHARFDWVIGFLGHIRFWAALVNPFTISKVRGARGYTSQAALLEPEGEPEISFAGDTDSENKPLTHKGKLIINADDWGRDRNNTDRIRECAAFGTVSSASAMVFMEDSERAAELAREKKFDTGLHLNLTMAFNASNCPPNVLEQQRKISTHLLKHRYAKAIFHPGLMRSFEYVVAAQLEEYERLYGSAPQRLDGHHHMHLCANVLFGKLIPEGIIVRRNFSFLAGEKSFLNRHYRHVEDQIIAKRHRTVDFFFSITPLTPKERLDRIFSMSHDYAVEVETHPVNVDEYNFLTSEEIHRWIGDQVVSPGFLLPAA